jgi:hypothetical protein
MPIPSPPQPRTAIVICCSLGSRIGIVPDAAYDLVLRPYQPLFFSREGIQ